MIHPKIDDAFSTETELLQTIQKDTFGYFWHEANSENGLILDNAADNWPSNVAAVGMALTAYPVGVERQFISRQCPVQRTLVTLKFFASSEQSASPDATGY